LPPGGPKNSFRLSFRFRCGKFCKAPFLSDDFFCDKSGRDMFCYFRLVSHQRWSSTLLVPHPPSHSLELDDCVSLLHELPLLAITHGIVSPSLPYEQPSPLSFHHFACSLGFGLSKVGCVRCFRPFAVMPRSPAIFPFS